MSAPNERLARRVGAVALAAIALAIVFFVFLYDRIEWGAHTRIRVYFHDTGGVREGTSFVVAGRAIGKVEAVALVPKGTRSPLGGEEGIALVVALERSAASQLTLGGDVFVASKGPLSDKYLELAPPLEPGAPLREGAELLGRDPPSLDRVLQRTWDNMQTMRAFMDDLRPEIEALRAQVAELQGHLGELAPGILLGADVDALIAEAHETYDALGGRPGLDRMGAVVDHARATLAQGRAMLDALDAQATALRASLSGAQGTLASKGTELVDKVELAIARVRASIDRIDPLLAQVQAVNGRIARGEGSLLKLMHDPEFPEDAKELGKILKRHPWKVMEHPKD